GSSSRSWAARRRGRSRRERSSGRGREYPEVGGLVSYGPVVVLAYRQIGQHAGRTGSCVTIDHEILLREPPAHGRRPAIAALRLRDRVHCLSEGTGKRRP